MNKKPVEIKKMAMFTDCHFGKKSNSRIHNQDIINYITWFCNEVKKDSEITHIAFLGDWYESRTAINIETLDFSRKGVQLLDSLRLPILFVVGNHDLHRRTTRDIHSVKIFDELKNLKVIDQPTVIDNILFSPYLFSEEYDKLIKYNDLWAFAGHFEFKNFYITGYNTILEHGPDHKMFPGPKKIFSGHFHKRQANDNVVYIGNTFPMDFGDEGDSERGLCKYTIDTDYVEFINWQDCPTYEKISLSLLLAKQKQNTLSFKAQSKVKCLLDIEISYSEARTLKEEMIEKFNLRDFSLEENKLAKAALLEEDSKEKDYSSIDHLVVDQLKTMTMNSSSLDKDLLVKIYEELPLDLEIEE